MFYNSFAMAALVTGVFALDFSNWQPAGPNDSRGPCPGLNSLANHNFIAHDGRGLTIPVLVEALKEVYNFDTGLATALSISALLTNPNPMGLHFELHDLAKHNAIEHDGSLTRADFHVGGDDYSFRPELYAEFMSHFAGMETTTAKTAGWAKIGRVRTCDNTDPDFYYKVPQFIGSWLETAVYLMVLGQGNDTVPISWMDSFFAHEKLPADLGWETPETSITITSLGKHALDVLNEAGDGNPHPEVLLSNEMFATLLGVNNLGANMRQTVTGWIQGWLTQYGYNSNMFDEWQI